MGFGRCGLNMAPLLKSPHITQVQLDREDVAYQRKLG